MKTSGRQLPKLLKMQNEAFLLSVSEFVFTRLSRLALTGKSDILAAKLQVEVKGALLEM